MPVSVTRGPGSRDKDRCPAPRLTLPSRVVATEMIGRRSEVERTHMLGEKIDLLCWGVEHGHKETPKLDDLWLSCLSCLFCDQFCHGAIT